MDLKIGTAVVLFAALWLIAIFGLVGFNIAIGLSAWTWMSVTAWYTLRCRDSSEYETNPSLFEGDMV
ncbi:MAG: hypothetical protein ACW98Y_14180 [Candidatus Thorarchaeota archaeon]|jgi:hypothetical protein